MPAAGLELPTLPVASPPDRGRLVQRARLLAWAGLAWHGVEAAVALVAGIVAGSIALVGFGVDSLIEALAGVVVLWRFAGVRAASAEAETHAQRLVAGSFLALALYVGVEATRALLGGEHAAVSWTGMGLALVTLVAMPPLARAKARVGDALGSAAASAEGRQNLLCAYLSAALLVGLGANAAVGAWWADPIAALLVAAVAVHEARLAWRGEDACCVGDVGAGGCAPR